MTPKNAVRVSISLKNQRDYFLLGWLWLTKIFENFMELQAGAKNILHASITDRIMYRGGAIWHLLGDENSVARVFPSQKGQTTHKLIDFKSSNFVYIADHFGLTLFHPANLCSALSIAFVYEHKIFGQN